MIDRRQGRIRMDDRQETEADPDGRLPGEQDQIRKDDLQCRMQVMRSQL